VRKSPAVVQLRRRVAQRAHARHVQGRYAVCAERRQNKPKGRRERSVCVCRATRSGRRCAALLQAPRARLAQPRCGQVRDERAAVSRATVQRSACTRMDARGGTRARTSSVATCGCCPHSATFGCGARGRGRWGKARAGAGANRQDGYGSSADVDVQFGTLFRLLAPTIASRRAGRTLAARVGAARCVTPGGSGARTPRVPEVPRACQKYYDIHRRRPLQN
jgi:hypothetical protein